MSAVQCPQCSRRRCMVMDTRCAAAGCGSSERSGVIASCAWRHRPTTPRKLGSLRSAQRRILARHRSSAARARTSVTGDSGHEHRRRRRRGWRRWWRGCRATEGDPEQASSTWWSQAQLSWLTDGTNELRTLHTSRRMHACSIYIYI